MLSFKYFMKIGVIVSIIPFLLWECLLEASQKETNDTTLINAGKSSQGAISTQNFVQAFTPEIQIRPFEFSDNHTDEIIKMDEINNVLYILTLSGAEGSDGFDSKLYYHNMDKFTLNGVELRVEDKDVKFTRLFVASGVVIAWSPEFVIAISYTNGDSWTILNTVSRVNYALVHPKYPHEVVFGDENDQLYTLDEGHFESISHRASQTKWDPNNKDLYFLRGVFNDETALIKRLHINKMNTYIKFSVHSYGFFENNLWIFTKSEDQSEFLGQLTGKIVKGSFPGFINLQDLLVLHYTSHEIIVAVKNGTKGVFLFSAGLHDFKFSRVGLDYSLRQGDDSFCVEVEFFKMFPGLVLANLVHNSLSFPESFTWISFNNGVKWSHIKGPRHTASGPCNWPSCYLKLNLRCYSDGEPSSIAYDQVNPSLMVTSGTIYRTRQSEGTRLFVSIDAGFAWNQTPSLINSIKILNGGSLLVGIPKQLEVILHSVDLGESWMKTSVTTGIASPQTVFIFSSRGSLVVKAITFDKSIRQWHLVAFNFEEIFGEKECETSDFELFTPGWHNHSQCFQGAKGVTQRKRRDAKCKINPRIIRKPEYQSCPCTEDDFGCTFGYFSNNGGCLRDNDQRSLDYTTDCVVGKYFVYPSTTKKLPGNLCSSTKLWRDQQCDICGLTKNDKAISVLVGTTLNYLSVTRGSEGSIATIPIRLSALGYIKEYEFNTLHRFLYILNETGLFQISYGEQNNAYHTIPTLLLRDTSIIAFMIDTYTNAIYYFNATTISIVDVNTRMRKTLCKIEREYVRIHIVPEFGFLAVGIANRTSGKYSVQIMLMDCTKLRNSVTIEESIEFLTFDYQFKHFIIVTPTSIFRMRAGGSLFKINNTLSHANALNVYVDGKTVYFIKKDSIVLNDKVYYKSHIKYGQFHLRNIEGNATACKLAHCDVFCFPLSQNSYTCGCPDGFSFDHKKSQCVCDLEGRDCSKCRENEFHCDSGMCVDARKRCDGVDNCEDGSDERNCKMVCDFDELLCDNGSVCVGNHQICDGAQHCKDGKDEKNCFAVNMCNNKQFMCFNHQCVPKNWHCNGVEECADASDEVACDTPCKYYEAQCDNGQCIMEHQVCDNNFDCLDLSDERGCHKMKIHFRNVSCLLVCDGSCVPLAKLCNHISDCSDGADEVDCEHRTPCHSPDIHMCNSDFLCYSNFKVCDSFADCADQTDELNCDQVTPCVEAKDFMCRSTDTCISVNKYCDGVKDCPDNSDEAADCLNKRHVSSIAYKDVHGRVVQISWTALGYSVVKDQFTVTLFSKTSNTVVKTFQTDQTNAKIDELDVCERYTITVKVLGEPYGRYLDLTYKDDFLRPPHDLLYTRSKNILKWRSESHSCLPKMFFIQCLSNEETIYKNFTKNAYIFVSFYTKVHCRIAICPMTIFNISCSEFSTEIVLDYGPTGHFSWLKLVWIAVLGLVFVYFSYLFATKIVNSRQKLQPRATELT